MSACSSPMFDSLSLSAYSSPTPHVYWRSTPFAYAIHPTANEGLENADLVASGFDDICGRLRNSSRSIVPELSCQKVAPSAPCMHRGASSSARSSPKIEPCPAS